MRLRHLLVVVALVSAACGGDDSGSSATVEIVLAEVTGRTASVVFIANADDIDRAEVDWGDGLVVRVDGDGRFSAEHSYSEDGTYPIVVTVFADGGSARAAQTVVVQQETTTTSSSTTTTTSPEVTTSSSEVTTTAPEVTTTTEPATTPPPLPPPPSTPPPTTAAPPPPTTIAPPQPVSITKSFAERSSVVYQRGGPNGSSSGSTAGVNVHAKAAGVNEVSFGRATVSWTFPVADFGWSEPGAIVSVFVDAKSRGFLETSSSDGNAASLTLEAAGVADGSSIGTASDLESLGPGSSQHYNTSHPLGFGSPMRLDPGSTITVTVVVTCTASGANTIFGVFGGSECDFSSGDRGVDMTARVTLRPES